MIFVFPSAKPNSSKLPALVLGEPVLMVPAATWPGPCPTQQGSPGWVQPQESSQALRQAGHCGQGWPKANGKVAEAIVSLGVGPGPFPMVTSGIGLPHVGPRPAPQGGGTHGAIQTTVLLSRSHEMGCPSNISSELPSDTIYPRGPNQTNRFCTQCSSGCL